MTTLGDLDHRQAEQLQHLGQVWPAYGHAMQVAAATSGGLGWKTVKGVEYLVRYVHEDGKKRFTSYGRRNENTEAIYRKFEGTTGRARRTLKEHREDVALTCRLAKAHGLARLPGRQAGILEWFWYTDITRRLSLFGGTALLAYEAGAGAMAASHLIKESHLLFVSRTPDLEALKLDEIEEACDVDGIGCVSKPGRHRLVIETSAGEPRAEILMPAFFLEMKHDDNTETVAAALDLPPLRGLTVARDCRPIELSAIDPWAYAALAHRMRGDVDIWAGRASASVEMAKRIDRSRNDTQHIGPRNP